VSIDSVDATVQPLVRWLHTDATRVYFEWLALHPGYVLTEPFRDPSRVFNDPSGEIHYYGAPDRTDAPLVNAVFDPGPWWVLAGIVVAIAIGVGRRVWRRSWWRSVAVLGALGIAEMLVSWHGDGTEATRHGIVGSVTVRLAVLILIVGGATCASPRRPFRARAELQGQHDAAPGYAPAVTSGTGGN
jgi:hypothetical protein